MKIATNKTFILISLFFYLIATIVLILLKLEWYYFLLGFALSIITHALMIIQNKKMYEMVKSKYNMFEIRPRRTVFIWYFLKSLLVISFTISLVFIADLFHNDNAVRIIFIYIFGYLSLKIIFVILLITNKERG